MDISLLETQISQHKDLIDMAETVQGRYFNDCEKIVNLYADVYGYYGNSYESYSMYCSKVGAKNPRYDENIPRYFELERLSVGDDCIVAIVKEFDCDAVYHHNISIEKKHFEDDGEQLKKKLLGREALVNNFEENLEKENESKELAKKTKQIKQLQKEIEELKQKQN